MKDVKSLIKDLRNSNVRLSLNDENIEIESLQGELDNEILDQIRSNKDSLVAYFKKNLTGNIYSQIKPVQLQDGYKLSSSQRRLWILSQFKDGNQAYNIAGTYVFEGQLQKDALSAAFDALIERHESLRTVFREDQQGEIRQYIRSAEESGFAIEYIDFRKEELVEQQLKELIQAEFIKPFDLGNGPLIRAILCHVADTKWVLIHVMHHIVSDGWSKGILIRELLQVYNAYINGEKNPLIPLRIQYKDYAAWQQEQLQGKQLRAHRDYWLKQFDGELPILNLPGDNPRPAVKTYNGGSTTKFIHKNLCKGVKTMAQEQGSTLFMTLLAFVKTLLYRYTGQEDIVIGTSIASREHTAIEEQIGFYVNTLALRSKVKAEYNYKEVLEEVKRSTLDAYEHQVYPFDELLNDLKLQRDMSRHPLFDVMVVLQSAGKQSASVQKNLGQLQVNSYKSDERIYSKFDLTFFFADKEDELQMRIVYNADMYTEKTIDRLSDHLKKLMEAIIENPSLPVNQLDYMSAKEKEQLLISFNNYDPAYHAGQTVIDLFEEQVRKTPDSHAVMFGSRSLTYTQLNAKANQLAGYLHKNCKIKKGDLVGIMMDRSENIIVSMLGIMKAGAAYVAIDPENPKARKQFIIDDTAIRALITQSEYIFDLDYFQGEIFAIDIQLETLDTPIDPPEVSLQPDDLAYVVYTSGSTGLPKGVMISHGSLADYSAGVLARTNIRDCKKFGLVSTIAADLGNTVIYTSLVVGGELRIFSAEDIIDPDAIAMADLDCMKIVPSHWKALQDGGQCILPNKCLVFGGEQLTADVLDVIRNSNSQCHVYNHYGPSETTIGKLIKHLDLSNPEEKISLGTPFGNTSIYITDKSGNLVPTGVPGEICISGDGLSKGYLNNPALTSQKFVPNPYRPGSLMYKTGDMGKWFHTGEVEFIGRKDNQVKIRGYRIEPGEIESALQAHPQIDSAVVKPRTTTGGDKELVAYIVAKRTLSKTEINSFLGESLPAYMIPACYAQLPEMPLNANGKIDRNRLPDPSGVDAASHTDYVAPRNETEEKLVLIWQEVLEKERIGIKDNFFDLGGHSIKAVQLISRMNTAFLVRINIQSIFEGGTVELIAEQINFIQNQNRQNKEILKEIEI